jgi:cytochrome P450
MHAPSPAPATRAPVELKGHWLWGLTPEFKDDMLGALTRLGAAGDVVRARFGPFSVYFVNDPHAIRHMLQESRIYDKQTPTYARVSPLLGQGLLTSDGDFWLRQRRIAQPAFHRQKIAGFADGIARAARTAADGWAGHAERGDAIDMAAEMTGITLKVVCETMLGVEVGTDGEVVSSSFYELNQLVSDRMRTMVPPPLWIPTSANRRFKAALARLDETIFRIIARRRTDREQRGDLLAMLMHARDAETGESMNDRQLRDEVATMLLAGHETTAVALAWAMHLLAHNPEAEAKLYAELDALDGRPPEMADLERLPYARMAIDEAMRLYPPVWGASRNMAQDDVVAGCPLKRGTQVMFSSWIVHRMPSLWEDALAFRPERFHPDRQESLPKHAYFPFISGPRQCIGNAFALLEAHLVLATVMQRYRLRPVAGHPVEPEPLLTLRPKYGIKMTLEPRLKS